MHRALPGLALLASVALASCGGKASVADAADAGDGAPPDATLDVAIDGPADDVAIDAPAEDAAADAAGSCEALLAALAAAVRAAVACDPAMNAQQCTGMTKVKDSCSCSHGANDLRPDLAAAADAAYAAAAAAHCLPACGKPCFDAATWYCQPSADGATGTCAPAYE